MVSRKKSRKASRKRRSSKPKKIGYYVKNGKVLIAYEGHNRQGKLVHKDSAGKTIRKTVKIHKLKRDANKHAKSKKGRKASRKSSRKRKSAKRKASRKRKSAKRKASRKRKSAKRKSRKRKSAKRKASRKASRKRKSAKRKSRKRKSAKRKASRKRKSAKRKSRKRKSAKRKSRKRKASRKRKSKFRTGKKCGFSAGKKKRKYRLKKKKKRRRKKAWSSKAPMTRSSRMKLYRRDPSCFLLPPMHGEMPKYPICDKKGKKLCEGVLSAKMRADLVKNTHGRYSNKRARKSARRVSRKAVKIARDHGCRKMASLYRRHH